MEEQSGARLLSLKSCERSFDLIILVVFVLNVVVYTIDFLRLKLVNRLPDDQALG